MLGSTTSAEALDGLLGALSELRDRAASARLPLDVIGADEARQDLTALADQLGDYLLPRLREPEAPLLTVVGGPTGAGKSTLVNSLVGHPVSLADVLRPTTRGPVLVCAPDDLGWFKTPRVLPGFDRATGPVEARQSPATVQLVQAATPPGLALLDSPDIDSVVTENRRLAGQLLGAADLWILVTTAARYADATPWDLLTVARNRGTALAVLLNRVQADAVEDVTAHFASMLDRHGLGAVPVFVAHECPLGPGGLLPPDFVDPIRAWLFDLAGDERRGEVVRTTVEGLLDSLQVRIADLASAADAQVAGLVALRAQVDDSLRASIRRFRDTVGDGSLLRGDVLTRWNGFAGTGEFVKSAAAALARVRDRLAAAVVLGRPRPGGHLCSALAAGLVAMIQSVADEAAERIVAGWRGHPAGGSLLREQGIEVGRVGADLKDKAAAEVAAWQEHVVGLVKAPGMATRLRPRFIIFGPTGVGALIMIAAVTHTSALTEASASMSAAALSRRLLAAVVGEAAAQELSDNARRDLAKRIEPLLRAELARFTDLLDSVRVDPSLAAWLRCQQAAIEAARGAP